MSFRHGIQLLNQPNILSLPSLPNFSCQKCFFAEFQDSKFFLDRTLFSSLIHVTDWLPTLYAAAGGDLADLPQSIDGVNQWPSLADARVPSKSNRQGGGAIQEHPI